MLDGSVTDVVEGHSLAFRQSHIDIYSSSWGPDDDGRTLDGPGPLAQRAFKLGVETVREGGWEAGRRCERERERGRMERGRERGRRRRSILAAETSVVLCLCLLLHSLSSLLSHHVPVSVCMCAGSRWERLHICVG